MRTNWYKAFAFFSVLSASSTVLAVTAPNVKTGGCLYGSSSAVTLVKHPFNVRARGLRNLYVDANSGLVFSHHENAGQPSAIFYGESVRSHPMNFPLVSTVQIDVPLQMSNLGNLRAELEQKEIVFSPETQILAVPGLLVSGEVSQAAAELLLLDNVAVEAVGRNIFGIGKQPGQNGNVNLIHKAQQK